MKSRFGFSLIELLIVITLMSLILGLVAPLGFNMVQKAQAQTEYLALQQKVFGFSNQAFVSGHIVELQFAQESMTVIRHRYQQESSRFSEKHVFDYIEVSQPSRVLFNRNGIASVPSIDITVRNQQKQLVFE